MHEFMEFLNHPVTLTLLGLTIGKWLKGASWFETRAVPIANFVIALLVKLIAIGTGTPAPQIAPAAFHAAAFGPAVVLGFWSWTSAPIVRQIVSAAFQAALTTGVHSAGKNLQQLNKRP